MRLDALDEVRRQEAMERERLMAALANMGQARRNISEGRDREDP